MFKYWRQHYKKKKKGKANCKPSSLDTNIVYKQIKSGPVLEKHMTSHNKQIHPQNTSKRRKTAIDRLAMFTEQ